MDHAKTMEIWIAGTHCPSCEILLERQLKKVPGVTGAHVNFRTGKAKVSYDGLPKREDIESAVREHGYSLAGEGQTEKPDYGEIALMAGITLLTYVLLKAFDILPQMQTSETMSYGFIFLIGLVAAVSTCLAVSGGLLLAVVARHNEAHPELTGWQKFRPNIFFNMGRIASYTFFGAVIGAFGSVLALSPFMNGILIMGASAVMIVLGFRLLRIFPSLARFHPRMPKALGHKLHDAAARQHGAMPFLLGAGTFFLPCGFTIALQLYVLSTGSAAAGALTMLVFSLGTLPSLLSVGAVSSYVRGTSKRLFMQFAGVAVIVLGVFNLISGVNAASITLDIPSPLSAASLNPAIAQYQQSISSPVQKAEIVDGRQIAKMRIEGLNYFPPKFEVVEGIPFEWQIDASKATGCAQVITAPKLGLLRYLSPGKLNVISFIPEKVGRFAFSCTMGMTTPGAAFSVVPRA